MSFVSKFLLSCTLIAAAQSAQAGVDTTVVTPANSSVSSIAVTPESIVLPTSQSAPRETALDKKQMAKRETPNNRASAERSAPPPEFTLPNDPHPSLTPSTIVATAKLADVYRRISDRGGWPKVVALSPGDRGKQVAALKERLAAEGDLDPRTISDTPNVYDKTISAAVNTFQARMGLKATGIVSGATLSAMNVPALKRYQQMVATSQRLSQMRLSFSDRYIVVNLPSATVEAVKSGQVAQRFVAIVGDVEHQSPEVVARAQAVNLNPTWTVPASIIKNEFIPKLLKDKDYLSKLRIRVLDMHNKEVDPAKIDWTNEQMVANYLLRQDSGAGNSLGEIRINMPNRHAVYMHDTPSKRLFGKDNRFLSHGCVRVQGVYDLASWILEGAPNAPAFSGWSKPELLKKVATNEQIELKFACDLER